MSPWTSWTIKSERMCREIEHQHSLSCHCHVTRSHTLSILLFTNSMRSWDEAPAFTFTSLSCHKIHTLSILLFTNSMSSCTRTSKLDQMKHQHPLAFHFKQFRLKLSVHVPLCSHPIFSSRTQRVREQPVLTALFLLKYFALFHEAQRSRPTSVRTHSPRHELNEFVNTQDSGIWVGLEIYIRGSSVSRRVWVMLSAP